jgi:hypothetical protein
MDCSIDRLDPVQVEIFKKMTPEQKLRLSERLYFDARHLKAAWLHQLHPDWSDEQGESKVREIFLNART